MEHLTLLLDSKTWLALALYAAITGVLNLLIARRSQVDAWAESNPRLASVLKLVRSLGLDPWMVIQSLSLFFRGKLPDGSKDAPPRGPSRMGPAILLLVVVSLGTLHACSAPDPLVNARAENASLVLMRTSVEPADDWAGLPDRVERTPVCGAVAIGAREVVSAAHCVSPGVTDVALVTREQWFVTTDDYVVADVVERDPSRDVLRLRSREALRYTDLSAEEPASVLLVLRFETRYADYHPDRVLGTTLSPGHSGSGAFDERGDLVAMLTECYTDDAGECDSRGGLAVRP